MDLSIGLSLASVIVAALAFTFSVYTLILQRKDNEPKLQIFIASSFPRGIVNNREVGPCVAFVVSNIGQKPVYIPQISLCIVNRGTICILGWGGHKSPFKIEPGERWEITNYLHSVTEEQILQQIKLGYKYGYIEIIDGTHRHYVSNPFRLYIENDDDWKATKITGDQISSWSEHKLTKKLARLVQRK